MTEEEKKPYEEQSKIKFELNSPNMKFGFKPNKKTSFDFFRDSRKEILASEWEKMAEEEKKPYNEMAEKEKNIIKKRIEEEQEERNKAKSKLMKQISSKQTYKLVLLGDASVGKTSLISIKNKGVFSDDYKPTIGFNRSTITFQTSSNIPITFDCWDVAGQKRNDGFKGYCNDSDCMILMFDVTNLDSYKNLHNWFSEFNLRGYILNNDVNENAPWVLVGNKVDIITKRITNVTFHRMNGANYFEISCKTGYHVDFPFLNIARKLRNDPNLQFI